MRAPALLRSSATAFVLTAATVQAGVFLARSAIAVTVDPSTFGAFEAVLGWANLLSVLVTLGLHGAVSHFVALHADEKRRQAYFSAAVVTHSSAVAVFLVLSAGVVVALGDTGELLGFDRGEWIGATAIALGTTAALVSTADLLSRATRGPVVTSNWCRLVTLALLVAVVVTVPSTRTVVFLALGWAAGSAAQSLAVIVPTRHHFRRDAVERRLVLESLRYGGAALVHATGGWLLYASDRIALKSRVSGDELGRYSLAYLLAFAAQQLFLILSQLTRPWVYRVLRDVRARIGEVFSAGFVAAAVVGGSVTLLGPLVIPLITPERYGDVAPLVALLGAAVWWSGAYLVIVNVLFFFERVGLLAVITITTGAASLIPIFLLTDRLGVISAAWATLGAYGAEFVLVALVVRRLIPGTSMAEPAVLGTAITAAGIVQVPDWPDAVSVVVRVAAAALIVAAVVRLLPRLRSVLDLLRGAPVGAGDVAEAETAVETSVELPGG